MNGDELYDLVLAYYDFGQHRTGTAADLATADWFFSHLEERGAALNRREVVFDRYDAKASLVDSSGNGISCEPIYYQFLGRVETSTFSIETQSQQQVVSVVGINALLANRDQPIVVAIDGPAGQVVMPNRAIGDCKQPAAVVVPASDVHRLPGAQLVVDAQLVPGICEASSAVLGTGPPVTIATPLSGWYGAAGERGTGIAIALDLAVSLAATNQVTVVGCSGHELGRLGFETWLADALERGAVPVGPVLNLEASAAVAETMSEMSLSTARSIASTESGWFGTAADTPTAATSPEALKATRDVIADMISTQLLGAVS